MDVADAVRPRGSVYDLINCAVILNGRYPVVFPCNVTGRCTLRRNFLDLGHHEERTDDLDGVYAGNQFHPLMPGKHVVSDVEAKFRDEGKLTFLSKAGTAVGAFKLVICGKACTYACLRLNAPMVSQPPGIAHEYACTKEITLHPVIHNIRIQTEGEPHITNVVVRVDEICTRKEAVIHLIKVIAEFRGNYKMLPVLCVLDVFRIPEKEARPWLETNVGAKAHMLCKGIFKADIGSACSVPDEIVPDSEILRGSNPATERNCRCKNSTPEYGGNCSHNTLRHKNRDNLS